MLSRSILVLSARPSRYVIEFDLSYTEAVPASEYSIGQRIRWSIPDFLVSRAD